MLDLANLATSTLLGLLVAILAALLAVSRARTGTPALAGTPLVALAAPRGNTGRGGTRRTGRTSGGRGNGGTANGTGRGSSATGTGRSTTGNSGRANGNGENGKGHKANGNGGKATQPAPAPRAATPANAGTVNPVGGLARLVPGGLRDQVLAYLQAHPGEDFSPTQVANALDGRSSGAVGNALERLTEQGHVTKTSDAPRRFTFPTQGKARNGGTRRSAKAAPSAPAPTTGRRARRATADAPAEPTSPAKGRAAPRGTAAPAAGKANGTTRKGGNGGNGDG